MGFKNLQDFLNDDKDENEIPFDWEKEKQEWISAVDNLYDSITKWLAPFTSGTDSQIKISLEEKIAKEEEYGSYVIKKMSIVIKGQQVVLDPIGTMLIGAKGRVDMEGSYGKIRFLLVDKTLKEPRITVRIIDSLHKALEEQKPKEAPIEWGWKIATPPPRVQYIPLNEETFSESLLSVITND